MSSPRGLHLVAIGAKTVFFAPPESRALLRPEFNLCGEPFHTWDRIRRRRFISEAGGAEIEVREGEAFLIPKNWYHQVEYLEHSVGLSFRFTRTPAQNLLSLLVRQPISELLLLAEALEGEGMDEAALHWSRSALDVLAMERGEKDAYLALVTFLERSYEELVPSGKRYRSSVGDTEGFETLRRLAPPEHPKPVLRSPANEALEFARASLTHEDLKRMAERSIADEVHDPVRARRAFEAVGWTWPEGDPSPGTMRELLAGLRDHTRYL
jgi:hypothetical protein